LQGDTPPNSRGYSPSPGEFGARRIHSRRISPDRTRPETRFGTRAPGTRGARLLFPTAMLR